MKEIKMIGIGKYSIIPVRVFNKGTITFTPKAVIQIVSAANYAVNNLKENMKEAILTTDFTTLARLSGAAVDYSHALGFNTACEDDNLKELKPFSIELTGDKIATIKAWVQAKIDHCDAHRDDKSFNAETFYFLKDLIYDFRDMLAPQALSNEDKAIYKVTTNGN